MENIENGYKGRDTSILFDSQVAIKAFKNFEISYKLVWDCYQSLVKLAEYDRIQLYGCLDIQELMGMKWLIS